MSLYQELKRRNVLRVAIAYLAGSWLLIEVSETIFPLFGFDDTPARILVIVLAMSIISQPKINERGNSAWSYTIIAGHTEIKQKPREITLLQ